ncbi:CYTH domain-containing protein [Sinorhizobium kostiense]|uniref:CYTH domain-containing protein n=1 Tax=Sinorhizobium kostiense TaxID=76747 RepID=A0ABS4R6N4_9HYPH|nr:CYTH domain-containing protein [Sinorhizobium kostiense]MBP2237975.1 CYTH domain-containing protein [Sinorhizobium kostiense]
MTAEIERKFHVLDDRWRKHASKVCELQQAYIVSTKNRVVRVRLINAAQATLTVKIRTSPAQREEYEYSIPYADAVDMFEHALGTIEKTRYEVDYKGHRWEIDVYAGAHNGLVVAEVELRRAGDDPPQPVWVGPEITGNRLCSNRVLAMGARRLESGRVDLSPVVPFVK